SSAILTVIIVPSRVLTDSIGPSAFSISPRMRPGCCATAAVAAKTRAMAAAPNARATFLRPQCMVFLPICRGPLRAISRITLHPRRLQGVVNEIGAHQRRGTVQIDVERRLTDHAERGFFFHDTAATEKPS